MNKDYIENKLQSLISLRNTYINVLTVLIGGTIGLLFLEKTKLVVTLIIFGIIFIIFWFYFLFGVIRRIGLLLNILRGD